MKITTIMVGIMRTNCYILQSEQNSAVVIDPGDDGGRLSDRITNLGVTVKYILLTHGHFDHVGAVKDIVKRTGARVAVGEPDVELLHDPTLVMNRVQAQFSEKYHIEPDMVLYDGDVIKLDELELHIIATPGHTKGGVSILVNDKLFTGDTLFAGTCGRVDLYGGSEQEMTDSLRKLGALPGDYEVYPGHGDKTTLEQERVWNPCMRKALGKD